MDIFYIIKLLYRRRLLWISIPLITAIITFFFTLNIERTYKSSAQLATGYTLTDQLKLNEERFNVYEINVKFDNLIETINSPMVMGLLSYRLAIHDLTASQPFRNLKADKKTENIQNYSAKDIARFANIFQNKLNSMDMLSLFSEDDKELLTLLEAYEYDGKSLRDMLEVYRVRRTDYVSITSFSENPELSAFLVNTLCEEFLRYYNSLRNQRSSESVKTFSQLVDQKKKELDEKSEALREFKSTSRVFDLDLESTSKIERIQELETLQEEEKKKLRGLEYSLKSVNSRLESLSGNSTDILGNSGQNTEIIELRKKITELNGRYVNGGKNNKVLKDSLDDLRSQYRLITSANTGGADESIGGSAEELKDRRIELETQIAIARQDVAEVTSTLRSMRSTFGSYASKEAKISALERDVELASEEYLNAQNKYNEALDMLLATSSSTKQVLFGQPPQEPEPSKRLITIGLSGATSFILCILSILLLDFIDSSIKTPSFFAKTIPLNLIAVVNNLKIKQRFNEIFSTSQDIPNKNVSFFVESVRKLRYEIEYSNKKVILFVSGQKGEGKTSLVHAISHMFSRSRKKVLIIDTNFCNNDLTTILDGKPILEKLVETDRVKDFSNGITKTAIRGVDILGSEGGNYSPSEIFPENTFSDAIHQLRQLYDYILLEAAPLNDYSDGKELVNSVEGIVAVFSSQTSIKQTDKETINFLSGLGDRFIGSVLNKVEKENIKH